MPKIVVANWKMNKTLAEAQSFFSDFLVVIKKNSATSLVVCPSFPLLFPLFNILKESSIQLGCQNISSELKGAFTGEVSIAQIKDICSHVIVGHSERRQLFHETNFEINKKLKQVLQFNLTPIFCVGETLKEREQGKMHAVLKHQLTECLQSIPKSQYSKIWFAYEPVWAIGTGKNASIREIQEAHEFIRSIVGTSAVILYGGSVSVHNAREILSLPNVSGVLVGSASLVSNSLAEIVNAVSRN